MKCPKCGSTNPARAKFCNQCGADLVGVFRGRGSGQRRRVAVLFVDISGFTALSENRDPEDVKDIINDCLQRLAQVIYKYEGYIDKFIGDCIMALFGAPVTHEDDPLRAVITSMDLMKEIKKFNKAKGLNFSISIGINYGMVATGDLGRPGDYTVMGDAVNLAQRLQSAAPKGKIYVSKSVFEQTENEVVFKKLKQIKVKGKKEKVQAYEPRIIKRTYSIRRIKELPLIGRSHELNKLFNLFTEVKTGRGKVVSVVGEAGIGKSKLIYELKKLLINNIYIVEGRGIEYFKTSPYSVLKEILRYLFKIDEDDNIGVSTQKMVDFVRKLKEPSLLETVPFLKYFLSVELSRDDHNRFASMKPKDRIRMINEAVLSLLLKISRIKPLVIIFEDCHWIDPETINFMHGLAKEIARKSIMVISLYRPEFKIGRTSRLSYFSRINLKPLSPDDTVTLLCDLFRCERIEEKLIKLLLNKSARIPFYIHELSSNLLNDNVIFIADKVAKLKRGMESAIPRTLDELVMAKVDRLDSELRLIVDVASVIGDEFSPRLLREFLHLAKKLRDGLEILVRQDIIQAVTDKTDSHVGGEHYRFKHSITRDAIYNSLLKKHRKEYHRKIGYAMEKIYKDSLKEYYDALANHFVLGKEKEKAIEYLEKAGDRKKELYLNEEAIVLYLQSIELIDKSQPQKIAKICERLGYVYALIGKNDEAMNVYAEMSRYAKEDALLKVKSFISMASVARHQGLFDRALDLLNESRDILKTAKRLSAFEAKVEMANILSAECWIYRVKGEIKKAEKNGMQAISIIKKIKYWRNYENLKRTLAKAYVPLAIVYSIKGEYEKAIDLCEDTLMIAEEFGDRQGLGVVYNILGTVYRVQGRFNQAIDAYTKKLRISEELGDKSGVGAAFCNLGNVYQNKGEYEKAIVLFENYLKISEELGDKHGAGIAYVNLGIVYWNNGVYEMAVKLFKKYLKMSEELGDKRGIAVALSNLGEVYRSQFKFKKALELFKKHFEMSRELGDKSGVGHAFYNLGAVHTQIGKLDEAEKYLKLAEDIFKAIGNKIVLGNIYNYLSYLKLKQNKLTDALIAAKTAHRLAKETGSIEMKIDRLVNLGRIYSAKSYLPSSQKGTKVLLKRSKESFKKALVLVQNIKDKRLLADICYEYATVLKLGNKSEKDLAKKNFTRALKIYKKLNFKHRIKEIEKIVSKL